jgi:hypothetical protein
MFVVMQSPSSAFDLGAFVGDLTIEEDINGLIYSFYYCSSKLSFVLVY